MSRAYDNGRRHGREWARAVRPTQKCVDREVAHEPPSVEIQNHGVVYVACALGIVESALDALGETGEQARTLALEPPKALLSDYDAGWWAGASEEASP
jgi:hypothetical protein